MHPEVDTAFGVATGISPSSLGEALEQLSATGAPKHVAAVLVTSPTYYGVCSDVAGLAQVSSLPTRMFGWYPGLLPQAACAGIT